MQHLKPRERRQPIHKSGLLRASDGGRLISITDASKRGLGIRGSELPPQGEYVEIRLLDQTIVGRIVWSKGGRCGIVTQDDVTLQGVSLPDPALRRTDGDSEGMMLPSSCNANANANANAYEQSRSVSRAIESSAVWLIACTICLTIGWVAAEALNAPLEIITATLDPSG